jgi:hypothetical protein
MEGEMDAEDILGHALVIMATLFCIFMVNWWCDALLRMSGVPI